MVVSYVHANLWDQPWWVSNVPTIHNAHVSVYLVATKHLTDLTSHIVTTCRSRAMDIFIYGFFFLKMAKYNEQQCNNKAYK
jgi:hypothetical protein